MLKEKRQDISVHALLSGIKCTTSLGLIWQKKVVITVTDLVVEVRVLYY